LFTHIYAVGNIDKLIHLQNECRSANVTGVAGKFIAPLVVKNKEVNINNKLKVGGLKTMQIMHPLCENTALNYV